MVFAPSHIVADVKTREAIYKGWISFLENDVPLENLYPVWYHFLKHSAGISLDHEAEIRLVKKVQGSRIYISRMNLKRLDEAGIFSGMNTGFSKSFAAKWGNIAMRHLFSLWGTDSDYVRDILELHLLQEREEDHGFLEKVREMISDFDYSLQDISNIMAQPTARIIRAVKLLA